VYLKVRGVKKPEKKLYLTKVTLSKVKLGLFLLEAYSRGSNSKEELENEYP
jgi:hypothetical protein